MMMEDLEEYWRRVFRFSPFTVWFNLTGQPAMMIPLGVTGSGFPGRGAGRSHASATRPRCSASPPRLEAARPWIGRRPALASAP